MLSAIRFAAVFVSMGFGALTAAPAAGQNVSDERFGDQNASAGLGEGNPIIPGLFADPSIAKFGDTFYLYTTTDGFGWQTGRWVTWTSTDLENWSFRGESFPEINGQNNWAPGKPFERDRKFFLPFTLRGNAGHIAVADRPEGPFRFAFDRAKPLVKTIDLEVFIDDDGTPWAIYGGTHIMLGKLTPNLSGFDGPPTELQYDKGYVEGPFLFKRNGIYYACAANLGYADYRMIYATSKNVAGPYTFPKENIVLEPDPANHLWGVGHGNVFAVDDEQYVVYLRSRSGEVGVDPFQSSGNVYRQICIDRLTFNADGTIQSMKPTRTGIHASGKAKPRETNLALGKPATASSSLERYGPEKATDGSFGTRWVVGRGEAVAHTAERAKVRWRYTFTRPADRWAATDFNAAAWSEGFGGFGVVGMPGAAVGTEWKGKDLWARRSITLSAEQLTQTLSLRVSHDDEATIYLNGVLAAKLSGWTSRYEAVAIRAEALAALRAGENVLAVHCSQDSGGQYLDVGLTAAVNEPWWQIDLGTAQEVSRTEISFNYPTEITPYLLESSVDGTAWQVYANRLRDDVRESPKVDRGPVSARYFRVRFPAPSFEEIPAGVWEFKAFGQP